MQKETQYYVNKRTALKYNLVKKQNAAILFSKTN